VSDLGLFTGSLIRGGLLVAAASAAAGSLTACGMEGSLTSGSEPPFGQIGFVGGVGTGVGFVGGGKGHHDGGSLSGDAATAGDAGEEPVDGAAIHGGDGGRAIDGASVIDGGADDGGSSIGVVLNIPPGFFASLDWVISGPAGFYSGTVQFGHAQSIEFVVGGVLAGDGYTLTLTGTDPSGDFCTGTSAPFTVLPGATAAAGVTIECFTGDGGPRVAPVMTGSVAVDAGVAGP
jgi:hypothetical protein